MTSAYKSGADKYRPGELRWIRRGGQQITGIMSVRRNHVFVTSLSPLDAAAVFPFKPFSAGRFVVFVRAGISDGEQ